MSITEALVIMGFQFFALASFPPVAAIALARMKSKGKLPKRRLAWLAVAEVLILWLALQVSPGLYPWQLAFWKRTLGIGPIHVGSWARGPEFILASVIAFSVLPAIVGYWWFKMRRIADGDKSKWKERSLGLFVLVALLMGPILISANFVARLHNFISGPTGRYDWYVVLLGVSLCIILLSFYVRFWEWTGRQFLPRRRQHIDSGPDVAN